MRYLQLLQDRQNFKKSSTGKAIYSGMDTPGHVYFKIFFHFNNGDESGLSNSGGLLALPNKNMQLQYNDIPDYDNKEMKYALRATPSAWSYLIQNHEDERAILLQTFISNLASIMINTPWYFQKISGLDTALERKQVMDRDFKIEEGRQKISITCLPDAMDERVGTLLDLYRSIVFSWQQKREIIPANLRKFDMSIVIFENYSTATNNKYKQDMVNYNSPKMSYKYIELHNCEFDYTSSKSGYSDLNNADGFEQTYNIDIFFDDIFEDRYNQWDTISVGDMLKIDMVDSPVDLSSIYNHNQYLSQKQLNEAILNYWPENKFFNGALNQIKELATGVLDEAIQSISLGNIYSFSPKTFIQNTKNLAAGNVLNTKQAVEDTFRKPQKMEKPTGNIFDYNEPDKQELINLGNIYKNKSVANNI